MLQQFDGVVFIVEQPPTSAKKQWAYTTSQGVLGGLINEGWEVGGGGGDNNRTFQNNSVSRQAA